MRTSDINDPNPEDNGYEVLMICPECLWLAPFGYFTKRYAHDYIKRLSTRHPKCNTCGTKLRYTVTTKLKREHTKERAIKQSNYTSNTGNGFSGWTSRLVQEFIIGSNDIEWWINKHARIMGM